MYLANTARDAVVGQAKNRSSVHLLTRFRMRPHEMFRLAVIIADSRSVAQPGSALAWGARGRKFESCRSDQKVLAEAGW